MTGPTVGALFLGAVLHAHCLIKFPVMDTEMSLPVVYMLESSLAALNLFHPDFSLPHQLLSSFFFRRSFIIHSGPVSLI